MGLKELTTTSKPVTSTPKITTTTPKPTTTPKMTTPKPVVTTPKPVVTTTPKPVITTRIPEGTLPKGDGFCYDLNDDFHGKNGLGYKVDKTEGYMPMPSSDKYGSFKKPLDF